MKRRQALELTATMFGGVIIGAETFISGCSTKVKDVDPFSDENIIFLDEVGETILPTSERSPGAKETKIGEFMKSIVLDCYHEKESGIFISGIDKINELSKAQFNKPFLEILPEQRLTLLSEIDAEARTNKSNDEIHFFTMMKQLTIWGYFTSEPGATKALRYNPIPMSYKGCIDYKVGDKAWS